MSFRPCVSGCGSFLTSTDGHDRCLSCLGLEHAEAAFVDGSCVHCERMSMAALRSRLSFTRRFPSSSSRGSSSSRKGFTAATARHLGDLQSRGDAQTDRSPAQKPKNKMSISASEGEQSADEADVLAGQRPSAVAAPSEADAELSAMLLRAAKGIGLEVPKVPLPDPSRLNDWFLGTGSTAPPCLPPVPFFPEVHDELIRAWRAPYSARSRPVSSPLATLDGGAVKGYAGVPQVERAVAVHLCPQGAATWRGHPRLPSKACRFSSALAGRAYCAAGQAATALHAMATLQVYQAKALKKNCTRVVLTKRLCRSCVRRLTSLSGQPKSRRGPLVRPASSATLSRTLPSSSRQFRSRLRLSNTSCPGERLPGSPRVPNLSLLVAEGAPLWLPNLLRLRLKPTMWPSHPDVEAVTGERRRPLLRVQLLKPASLRSVPDTGSPEMAEAALRGTTTSAPPLPEEGRDLLCVQLPSTYGLTVPTHSQKEQISTSLGLVPRDLFLSDAMPPRVRTQSTHSPAWEPGKKVSAAQCGQTFLQDVHPSGISPLPLPAGCPTAVTSVNAPLIPLAVRLGAWLELPSPSRWLIRMVRLGYAIQFARRPPKFRGVLFTSVCSDTDASVLRAEIAVLLAKDAIEPVPPAEMKSGFYSPYFIVPMKSGGLRPILDLRVLNRSLLRLPFKMLTSKRILSCVRHQDWFAAIDLKDTYFHVSILPRHRPFLRFAFEGRAYQYKVLPFGLSLSPRVFTKVAEGALTPLWRKGVRILNYLDDWLIIAHSRHLLCEHRDLVLRHLSRLGLWVNREKSKLSPVQRISFLGLELDSVNMTACLTNERTQSVLNCLKLFRHKTAVPLKTFQRLLGHMAAAAAVTPLGLLHMRPLQRWLHDRVPRWAWHRGTLRIGVSPQCRRLFSP
ncbi:Transposon Ty3-G Gag-Pol polyprotein [Labeo rohita]|uniref:ribonuclease H n=1 Tax=Labeo rohita TaxID=84645 RepID=A0ABQ8LK75_LABRO|nr:Transposon Ty3-G Gag-Pol polyprotein [Labeo rohita]